TAGGSVSKRTWSHTLAREDPHHTYRRGIRLSRTAYPEIRRHVLGPTRQEKRESLPGESSRHYPYSDTSRTCAPNTRIYGYIKGHFPSSPVTAKPRFYVGKFGHCTKVTL